MNKFSGKNNYYGPLKIEENNGDNIIPVNHNIEDNITLDFTDPKNTLGKLYEDLENAINHRTPMFLWSKERHINKITLDNEYMLHLKRKIEILREVSSEFIHFQVDTIFSIEQIKSEVKDKRITIEHYFETKELQHLINKLSLKAQAEALKSTTIELQINLDEKRAKVDSIVADNERKRAENESIKTQNELRKMMMGKVDFSSFPPKYLSDLLLALSGINISFSQYEMSDWYNELLKNLGEAKAKKSWAEVDDFINSAEFRKWKNDRAKGDAEL